MQTKNFQMSKLDLEKEEEPEIKLLNICCFIEKAMDFQKNSYLCFIDYTKAVDCVDHKKPRKALKETGIPDPLTRLLRNLNKGQAVTVRTLYRKTDWFKFGKEYKKAVCCHPVCLTYMLSTS